MLLLNGLGELFLACGKILPKISEIIPNLSSFSPVVASQSAAASPTPSSEYTWLKQKKQGGFQDDVVKMGLRGCSDISKSVPVPVP